MTINLVRSGSLYTGVSYAYAAVAPRGPLIFTAGACPLDDRGQVVGAGDVRAQASLAMANLATALAESGATLADVLKTTVFVASAERADLVAAWDVISAAFGEHDAPSTLLGVAVLGYADQLVEIEAVAVAPGNPGRGSQGEEAAVPVSLDPGVAPPAHPDLQDVGHAARRGAEPDLKAVRVRRAEAGQPWRRHGSRVHVRGCPPAAHPRVRRPDPQPPATPANELPRLGAHIHPHDTLQVGPRPGLIVPRPRSRCHCAGVAMPCR